SDGREAILAALALHAQDAFLEIQVGHLQLDKLADANARGVEHFEHRLIASAEDIGIARRIQQLLNLLQIETLGQALFLFGRADRAERIDAHHAAADEEFVEAAERRELSSRRALGVILAVEIV